MGIRSGVVPWLVPLVCGLVLAVAGSTPSWAAAAPGSKRASSEDTQADARDADADADDEGDDETSTPVRATKGAAMKKRFSVGALRTLSGLNALYGRFYAANRLTLGLTAGFATFSHRETDDTGEFGRVRTVGAVAVGPEVFFWPVQGPRSQQVHADFGVGARVITYVGFLGIPADQRSDTLDTPLEIDLEIPLKIQLFVGRRVSINPEFGVALRFIPGSREADQNGDTDANPGTGIGGRLGAENGPGLGFELGNHAGLFMGIGVGYTFGRLSG